jgi:hypothetical protein
MAGVGFVTVSLRRSMVATCSPVVAIPSANAALRTVISVLWLRLLFSAACGLL